MSNHRSPGHEPIDSFDVVCYLLVELMTNAGGRGYDVLALTSALWFLVQGLRYLFPPLFETIQGVYGVSNTVTGLLFTTLLGGYAVIQFPAGLLADKFTKDYVILFGAIGFGSASLITFVAPGIEFLFVGAVLIGVTTGVHKTVAIPFLSEIYEERKGLGLGVMDTIGQFGGIVAPMFVVLVLSSKFHWQNVFLAGALVSFVLAAAFYMQVSRSPAIHSLRETQENDQPEADVPEETSTNETYSAILTDTKMVAFLTVAVIVTFAWNGLSSFLPLYFAQAKAMSVGNASLLYSLLFMASFSQAVTGWLSDTLGRVRMILILLLLVVIGISIMLYTGSLLGLGVATVIAGLGFHGFRPVRDSYFMELIPSSVGGGTLGIVRTAMVTIGAAGPAILGYFSDVVGFQFAIAFVISITLLAMVVVGLFLRN